MVIQELLILVQTAGVIAACMVVIRYAGCVVAALRGGPQGTVVNVWIGNERGQGNRPALARLPFHAVADRRQPTANGIRG